MRIEVDCEKIRANAAAVTELCGRHGIEVTGVTKCVCGEPEVARAMLAGGCTMLADSRLKNIARMRDAGIEVPFLLLRLPALSEAVTTVRLCDLSLVSEVATVHALSAAAQAENVVHQVILMVEGGDRREGIMPEDTVAACRDILGSPSIELAGIGTSLNCLCGVLPTPENQQGFARFVEQIEAELGMRFRLVSAGHTGNLHLVQAGHVPERFNHFRVGEAILAGTDFSTWADLPVPHQDAFKVYAEVIEVKDKPSAPDGEVGPDAFMRVHEWPDLGVRRRAVVSLGEIDLSTASLKPMRPGVTVVGASSDHLVLDVTEASPTVRLGEELGFDTLYPAVSTGWASSCTTKIVHPLTPD